VIQHLTLEAPGHLFEIRLPLHLVTLVLIQVPVLLPSEHFWPTPVLEFPVESVVIQHLTLEAPGHLLEIRLPLHLVTLVLIQVPVLLPSEHFWPTPVLEFPVESVVIQHLTLEAPGHLLEIRLPLHLVTLVLIQVPVLLPSEHFWPTPVLEFPVESVVIQHLTLEAPGHLFEIRLPLHLVTLVLIQVPVLLPSEHFWPTPASEFPDVFLGRQHLMLEAPGHLLETRSPSQLFWLVLIQVPVLLPSEHFWPTPASEFPDVFLGRQHLMLEAPGHLLETRSPSQLFWLVLIQVPVLLPSVHFWPTPVLEFPELPELPEPPEFDFLMQHLKSEPPGHLPE